MALNTAVYPSQAHVAQGRRQDNQNPLRQHSTLQLIGVTVHCGLMQVHAHSCMEPGGFCCRTSPTGLSAATTIGRYVTIGPGCVLRSATVEDEVLIGEKCVLMEGSLVENHSILAPGSVLPPGRLVPSGQVWAGNPAKFVRNLSKDEVSAACLHCPGLVWVRG